MFKSEEVQSLGLTDGWLDDEISSRRRLHLLGSNVLVSYGSVAMSEAIVIELYPPVN